MLITPQLIKLLDRAQTPRGIRAVCWMLEKATGFKTTQLLNENGTPYLVNGKPFPVWNGIQNLSVMRDKALESSAFFAGVKIISEDIGALPFFTYRRSRDRSSIEKAYDHPLYPTLHDLVNPDVSAGEFVESLTAHALMTGNGYAEVQRVGHSIFLYPWQPEQTRQDIDEKGNVVYLNSATGKEKTYGRKQVFHLKGWTINGAIGVSLLERQRRTLGITLATDIYAEKFFENDATPGIVIEFPTGSGPTNAESAAAFKAEWKKWHQGYMKSHEPGLLLGGAKIGKVTQNNSEAQLLQLRQHQVEEVCRILRLPPHKLSDLRQATNNNIEHLGIDYGKNTLGPWVDRWRRSVYRCLLTNDEQIEGRIWAEMEIAGLLRGDFATQSEGWRKLLEKGVYSINDVRKLLNLNPIEAGDQHFVQLNLGTVQDVAAGLQLAANKPDLSVPNAA